MIETLLGGLLGRAFRLAPEILKWLDRKGERGHELAMQDKALKFEKLRGVQRMSEIGAGADAAWNVGAIETLREAVRTQGEKTGVRWADALSSSVRPVITYWFMALYCAAKTATVAEVALAGALPSCMPGRKQIRLCGLGCSTSGSSGGCSTGCGRDRGTEGGYRAGQAL